MKPDFVEDFLARYRKEYDFFDQAGRLASQILEGRLRAAGIRSIVTSRAKAIDRLKTKVRERAAPKGYSSAEDIFADIIDLAGVRVALYFPGELVQVDKIVRAIFVPDGDPKTFPDPLKKPPYEKRFSGYLATHYKVRMKESVLLDAEKRYSDAKIEIQVASVLMHSWAEVEHDLVYKPQQGALSDEEYDILDELNGLVLAGEIALTRLQKAGKARVAKGGRYFSNHYDLALHLLGTAAPVVGSSIGDTALGRIDLLFVLLKRLNLDTPDRLSAYVKALSSDLEKRPLADQIIDQLLGEDKKRYPMYERIRASRPVPGDYLGQGSNQTDTETQEEIGRFLERWVTFEQKLNAKAKGLGAQGLYPSRTLLSRLGIKDETLLKDFERIRRVRNDVVHGLSLPPLHELRNEGSRIEELSNLIDSL
jgi:ppGpp synthetase/RelA/SpoT-type nucleotidyltranferase